MSVTENNNALLFKDMLFAIAVNIHKAERDQISSLLKSHGGLVLSNRYPSIGFENPALKSSLELLSDQSVTYSTTNASLSSSYPEGTLIITKELLPINSAKNLRQITPLWVDKVILHKRFCGPEFYSPDPVKFCSGIVAYCEDQIPTCDVEVIYGGLEAFGGQWRTKLTDDTTHLIALSDTTETSRKAQAMKSVKIILPHYFDDCFLLRRYCPDDAYLFPNPRIRAKDIRDVFSAKAESLSAIDSELAAASLASAKVDDPFLQGHTLFIDPISRKDSHLTQFLDSVKEAGATISSIYESGKTTIAVMDFQNNIYFRQALIDGVIVGTFRWLQAIVATKAISSPQLAPLHFPRPATPIKGADQLIISVSNYAGTAREDIATMAVHIGAQFTRSMTNSNTHLVCSSQTGTKYIKALEWNIHIVNHLWIEETYVHWVLQRETKPSYFRFTFSLCSIVNKTPVEFQLPPLEFSANLVGSIKPADSSSSTPNRTLTKLGSSLTSSSVYQKTTPTIIDSAISNQKGSKKFKAFANASQSVFNTSHSANLIPVVNTVHQLQTAKNSCNLNHNQSSTALHVEPTAHQTSLKNAFENSTPLATAPTISIDVDPVKEISYIQKLSLIPEREQTLIPRAQLLLDQTPNEAQTLSKPSVASSKSEPCDKSRQHKNQHEVFNTVAKTANVLETTFASNQYIQKSVSSNRPTRLEKPNSTTKSCASTFEQESQAVLIHPTKPLCFDENQPNREFSNTQQAETTSATTLKRKRLQVQVTPTPVPKSQTVFTTTMFSIPIQHKKIMLKLGAVAVDHMDFTCLVASKIVRTTKFLVAVIQGKPIVHPGWVLDSISANTLLPTYKYILKDKAGEDRFRITLFESISKGIARPLLRNIVVYFTVKVVNVIAQDVVEMLVRLAGGSSVLIGFGRVHEEKVRALRKMCLRRDTCTNVVIVYCNGESIGDYGIVPKGDGQWPVIVSESDFMNCFLRQSLSIN
ncbi:hypothetical protein BDV3_004477 [Batrachochytrium dendrobatidis]